MEQRVLEKDLKDLVLEERIKDQRITTIQDQEHMMVRMVSQNLNSNLQGLETQNDKTSSLNPT